MILVVAEKSCKSLGLMDQTTNIAALDDRYNVFIYLVETTIKFEELTGATEPDLCNKKFYLVIVNSIQYLHIFRLLPEMKENIRN